MDTGEEPNIVGRSNDILNWAKTQVEEITGIKSPLELEDLNISTEDYTGDITKPLYVNW